MPLSGLTEPKYVAIVQSTVVTALTISASKFDLDQCAPLPEAGPGSIDVRQGRCSPDGAIHAFAHMGGPRLESKIQQLGVSSSFKILHDRIVTPGDASSSSRACRTQILALNALRLVSRLTGPPRRSPSGSVCSGPGGTDARHEVGLSNAPAAIPLKYRAMTASTAASPMTQMTKIDARTIGATL